MNKKSVFRFLLTSLFIVSVLAITLPTTSASAAPSCTGSGCNNKDPYTMRCAGSGASYGVVATTKIYDLYTHADLGYTQLWWSYTCKTNWTRTVAWHTDSESGVFATVFSGNITYENWAYGATEVHSAMVYAPNTLSQACGEIDNGNYFSSACTVWK